MVGEKNVRQRYRPVRTTDDVSFRSQDCNSGLWALGASIVIFNQNTKLQVGSYSVSLFPDRAHC